MCFLYCRSLLRIGTVRFVESVEPPQKRNPRCQVVNKILLRYLNLVIRQSSSYSDSRILFVNLNFGYAARTTISRCHQPCRLNNLGVDPTIRIVVSTPGGDNSNFNNRAIELLHFLISSFIKTEREQTHENR